MSNDERSTTRDYEHELAAIREQIKEQDADIRELAASFDPPETLDIDESAWPKELVDLFEEVVGGEPHVPLTARPSDELLPAYSLRA